MPSVWIELKCPEHGLERFKIKVIKKYNINPETIMPKYRTRPTYEISSIIVGRNVSQTEIKDYIIQYFREAGLMEKVLSIRLL
ncbi:MAG: hypothetical protein QXQ61_00770 [Candidatus Bathyarchaeia archaeon]